MSSKVRHENTLRPGPHCCWVGSAASRAEVTTVLRVALDIFLGFSTSVTYWFQGPSGLGVPSWRARA